MYFERGDISQQLLVEIGRVLLRDMQAIIQKWLDSISPGDAESPAHRDQLRDHLPQFIAAVGKDLADRNFDEGRERDTLAMDDYVSKPIDIGILLETIDRVTRSTKPKSNSTVLERRDRSDLYLNSMMRCDGCAATGR